MKSTKTMRVIRSQVGLPRGTGLRRRLYDAGLAMSGFGSAGEYYDTVVAGDIARLAAQYQRSTLDHAASQVPYYQPLGLSGEPLGEFPIISKAFLRQHHRQLISQASKAEHVDAVRVSSGGSSGEPVSVWLDQNALHWDLVAAQYYRYVLLGIDPQRHLCSRKVNLWDQNSRTPGRATDLRLRIGRLVSRTTYLNPCVLSDEILGAYVQRINKLKPAFITAYSSSLYELAKFAEGKGICMHRPLMIFTGGDTLFLTMRRGIERVFACRIYDGYGSREAGLMAGECPSGRLHVLSFNNTVEVVDAKGYPVAAGQGGRLLVTSHHNHTMPLIRFDTGDLATAASGICDCGSPLPFLNRVIGRVVEHFPTREGKLVTGGYFFHLFHGCEWIAEFYILQDELNRITVSYRRNRLERYGYEDVERITSGIRRVMGADCVVKWQEVDCIPRTPHGKRLFTRSLVWEDRHAELHQEMVLDGP